MTVMDLVTFRWLRHWLMLLRFRGQLKRLPTVRERAWPHPQRHR